MLSHAGNMYGVEGVVWANRLQFFFPQGSKAKVEAKTLIGCRTSLYKGVEATLSMV